MMNEGFAIVLGYCVACAKQISFNPVKVPSLRVNGERRPLCMNCFDKWNVIHRINKGLVPLPLAPDAYAACPESEIPA